MYDMNSDEILEVPDTPDRIQQSTYHVSSSIVRRDDKMAAPSPSPRHKLRIKFRNCSMQGSSSEDNACSVLPSASDTNHIFKQAEASKILELSRDYKAKFSLQKSDRAGTSADNEKRAEKHGLDKSRNISNNISCGVTGGRNPSFQVKGVEVSQQDANHQNTTFLGIGSGLPTIPVGKARNRTCTSTTDKCVASAGTDVFPGSSSGEVIGEVINKVITGPTSPPRVLPRRHVGQKRLVCNGCISPSNIAKKSVKVDEKQEMRSSSEHLHHPHPQIDAFDRSNVIDLTDNSPIMTRQRYKVNDKLISGHNMDTRAAKKLRIDRAGGTSIPQSEYHANNRICSEVSLSGCNNKGKEISSDVLDSDQIREANLRRVYRSAAGTSYLNKNSSDINVEQGWRTTLNNTRKLPIMGSTTSSSGRSSGSSVPSNLNHGPAGGNHSSVCGATIMVPDRIGTETIMIGRARRKQTSTSSHPGESSSALDEPRGSFVQSSKPTTGRNHTSHQHNTPVITIDDISPEARPSSSGYTNGTSVDTTQAQLESDELLARQLQEQLYNESPRFASTEEIDAIVAMSLQHEEDTHRTSRPVRRFQNNTRGVRAYRNPLRAELAMSNNMISPRQNTAPVTLGLGAVLARYPGALHIQPNINLNDYDALLALDENNHQHTGASESQINNLPQSVVQSNNIEEPCSVCLENPSVGDTIRHLPCFHKFHKECIDEWLRRKKLCPICKSGIS